MQSKLIWSRLATPGDKRRACFVCIGRHGFYFSYSSVRSSWGNFLRSGYGWRGAGTRSAQVFISFSDDSVLRAIGVDHSPVSRRHLRQLLAYRPIAHRTRHSGAAAVAGILPVARAIPWLVGMVFTYPTRTATNFAF